MPNYQSNQGACLGMACQQNEGENLINICSYIPKITIIKKNKCYWLTSTLTPKEQNEKNS
jgi:hypothetical protein